LNTLTITLPPPNPKLHAHAKGGWRAKVGATKELRQLAWSLALEACEQLEEPWPAASVEYRFCVPDLRRRDAANMIQATKPAIDGLVDAGLIPDDDWRHLGTKAVIVELDRENPRVELMLERTERVD